ncbi:uncharacterized protein LOC125501826 [Athalia rosae]|uniref:uncharacterized protein LOC125501826 n=1 Tax=Athalia rosae TaxID=37344 RepID=UPI00203320D5|nr:uncharacterized protein LOC125501826 [Athalia rosae]
MKTFIILLLSVAAVSAAATNPSNAPVYEASLNEYIDNVIGTLQEYIRSNNIEPVSITNITQSFSEKPLWITYSGRLSLFDGGVTGLVTLRRYGDVELVYSNKVLIFTANLGVDRLMVNYNYQAKLLSIKSHGGASGTVKNIDATISFTLDLENYKVSLNTFNVNNVGKVSVKLTGNKVTDWLASIITNIVVSAIKDKAITTVEGKVSSGLTSVLENVNTVIAPRPW